MLEEMIKSFMTKGCHGDTLKYKEYVLSRSKSVNEDQIKGQWSYITEIMIITIKSLVPSRELVGTVLDYTRFQKELKLWNQYRHGSNDLVLNSSKDVVSDSYWTDTDDSIYARVFPLVAANTRWEIIKDEIIKNLLYTTGNISEILETVALSRLLFSIMNNVKDYEELISDLKEETIHFAQKDFLQRYKNDFKLSIDTYPGNYTITFERKKIALINILNEILLGNDFETLRNTVKLLKGAIDSDIDTSNFWLMGFKGALEGDDTEFDFKDKKFIESLGGYLLKLRKGRIGPETLEVSNYELPDIFAFNIGEEFDHTLLNKSKVIKKEVNSNFIVSYVQTKTGIYRFFKRDK